MKQKKIRTTYRSKWDVVREILIMDNKYTSDYLMTWDKHSLISYRNNLVKRNSK